MNKSRLGFITPGSLIALSVSAGLILLAMIAFGNQIYSPGLLNQTATGQILKGARTHADLARECKACHPAPWSGSLQNDYCLDCHNDVRLQLVDDHTLHGAIWISGLKTSCRDCHTEHLGPDGILTTYGGEGFPHESLGFSLSAHSQADWDRKITCKDCHPGSLQDFEPSACQSCHQAIDPGFTQNHSGSYGDQCLACHDGLETITNQFAHDRGGFPLTGAHREISCSSCHDGSRTEQELRSTPAECQACHLEQDIHASSLGPRCGDCHATESWSPATFDHTATGFPLTFGHSGLLCSQCHQDRSYQGTTAICFSCHQDDDPHLGLFGDSCDTCHNTITWSDVSFDHTGPFVAFCSACHLSDKPGVHYPGECSACHQTAAWLPAFFDHAVAGAVDCQNCHLADKPLNHFPGQCSYCHNTAGWKPAFFSHSFPLSHGGANNNCTLCHVNTNYSAYTCYLCHEHNKSEIQKEHEGVSNLDNCLRCHWDGRKHDDGDGDDD